VRDSASVGAVRLRCCVRVGVRLGDRDAVGDGVALGVSEGSEGEGRVVAVSQEAERDAEDADVEGVGMGPTDCETACEALGQMECVGKVGVARSVSSGERDALAPVPVRDSEAVPAADGVAALDGALRVCVASAVPVRVRDSDEVRVRACASVELELRDSVAGSVGEGKAVDDQRRVPVAEAVGSADKVPPEGDAVARLVADAVRFVCVCELALCVRVGGASSVRVAV
jgi:hypothetical protein